MLGISERPRLASVRPSDLRHLQEIVEHLQTGSVTRSDVVSLILLMRGEAQPRTVLRDVGDCIAHDARDRGVAHAQLREMLSIFVQGVREGGWIESHIVYPEDVLRLQVIEQLERLGIAVAEKNLAAVWPHVSNVVADILDGTVIELGPIDDVEIQVSFVFDEVVLTRPEALGAAQEVGMSPGVLVFFPHGIPGAPAFPDGSRDIRFRFPLLRSI